MATISFSGIANGSTIAFDPAADVLRFDFLEVSAADVVLSYAADYSAVSFSVAGVSFSLPASVYLVQLTSQNVTFIDGSRL
jgi:hypothetical protein